jgi:hypothetical protein
MDLIGIDSSIHKISSKTVFLLALGNIRAPVSAMLPICRNWQNAYIISLSKRVKYAVTVSAIPPIRRNCQNAYIISLSKG